MAARGVLSASGSAAFATANKPVPDMSNGANNFYKSKELAAQKVAFNNQYKMRVVGNLFTPKDLDCNPKHPAIIIGHPMGAVKQQGSNLYARQQSKLVIVPGAGHVDLYD